MQSYKLISILIFILQMQRSVFQRLSKLFTVTGLRIGEDSWESLGLQESQPVHPTGNQSWIFIGRTDAEAETPTLQQPDRKNWLIGKRPWCWESLKAGGEGDNRRWDGWIASPTRWTWFWASSGSWWWTGKPGVLQSMGMQRVGHDWETELIELNWQG